MFTAKGSKCTLRRRRGHWSKPSEVLACIEEWHVFEAKNSGTERAAETIARDSSLRIFMLSPRLHKVGI
jgi:hypothetical protein